MSKQTLDRILQSQGFGTRKWCRQLIDDGEVFIAGQAVTDYRAAFETTGVRFTVFDEEWEYRQHVYIVLNKPAGYECSRKPSHHPGVLTLLPEQFTWRDVQPVGRLDHDTTGLLLLSDDGAFIHAQSSPKRHVPKLYLATTHEAVSDELVARLESAPLADIETGAEAGLDLETLEDRLRLLSSIRMNAQGLARYWEKRRDRAARESDPREAS